MTLSNKSRYLGIFLLSLIVSASPVRAALPSLLFSPSAIITQTNTQFTVSLLLDTAGQSVGGAGAKLTFDPYYLSAISLHPGELFVDYPAAIIDNEHGTITISGISASALDLYTGTGVFADIVFRPYHPGTSQVNFLFTPGSTTDSNIAVMTGNGDILASVNQLNVEISEGYDTYASYPTPSPTPVALLNLTQNPLVKTIAHRLGLSNLSTQFAAARPGRDAITPPVDPLAPLERLDPITDPSTTQPETPSTLSLSSPTPYLQILLIFSLVLLVILGVVLLLVLLRRRPHVPPTPPPLPN